MKNTELFNMVGHLVSMHRDKKIDDLDLYNSILRLIYSADEDSKVQLKGVVEWLDNEENDNTDRREQYSFKNVTDHAGEDYREGLMKVQPLPEK
jgi:hypothetical protein